MNVPFRWEGMTLVREEWTPRQVGAYATPPGALEAVREHYQRDRYEEPGRELAGYDEIARRADGDWIVAVLRHRRDEFCVEVRYGDGPGQLDVDVRPVPAAIAYGHALDADEKRLAQGHPVINARHPRP